MTDDTPDPDLQRIVEEMADPPRTEVRLHHGAVDDVVFDAGDLHFEDMDGTSWWLGFYRDGKRTTFRIHSKTKITVTLEENELDATCVEQE